MELQIAMTDVETAAPGLRSISMIIPQAPMLSNLQSLATGDIPVRRWRSNGNENDRLGSA